MKPFCGDKVGRFDPKKEILLSDQDRSPYAIGKNDEIIEYPLPYAEIGITKIRPDEERRMWFTSPANNKVGFVILPGSQEIVSERRAPSLGGSQ